MYSTLPQGFVRVSSHAPGWRIFRARWGGHDVLVASDAIALGTSAVLNKLETMDW